MSVAYSITPGAVFAPATGAKTFLLAIAPAGHGLQLVEFGISFDGVTSTAVPATVDIVQSTQAGVGTSVSAPVITQVRGRLTSGSAPTGGGNYSAEPSVLTVVRTFYVPQLMGLLVVQFPLGRELQTDSSASSGIKAIGIRVNVSAAVNVKGYMEVESLG